VNGDVRIHVCKLGDHALVKKIFITVLQSSIECYPQKRDGYLMKQRLWENEEVAKTCETKYAIIQQQDAVVISNYERKYREK